ncbi:MAG: LCP family protein [Culicoidibacterales bacterium]
MKKSKQNRKSDPHVAFYLEQTEEESDIATEDFLQKQEIKTPRRSNKRHSNALKKKRKQKKGGAKLWLLLLVIFLIAQAPMMYGIFSVFEWREFSNPSTIPQTKGILLLGVDDDGGDALKTGHTDSITYVGANFKTKKAIALPIYRDAQINQVCLGTAENINRIFRQQGIDCLVDSTAEFLKLPLDYYALISMTGLIEIINDLGTVDLVPTGTFCSDYGEDGINYCFTEGVFQKMTGPQALAYIRYRGDTSGENRANRQLELILAIKNSCMENLLMCYIKVTPGVGGNMKTNIPPLQLFNIIEIFGADFVLEKMAVIDGYNTTNELGWTQIVNEKDRMAKSDYIKEQIFSL